MPKHQKKRRPSRRSLALPDLERTKSAVLNSLTSKSGQRTYDHAINGTARNRDFPSIAPSSCGTESTWNRDASLQQRSTSAWPRSGVWHMRQLIPASSVPNLLRVSAESKVNGGSAFDCVTGLPPIRAVRCC